MRTVTLAGIVVLALVLVQLIAAQSGYIKFDTVKGAELVIALLLLDAAQDAADRGDEVLMEAASFIAVIVAILPLL